MIFFTVGTEQFDFLRMIQAADLVAKALPDEEVFIKIAENSQTPEVAQWERWLSYQEFVQRVHDARIVVTHAGAGSLLSCAWQGKVAITVPRLHKFGEHVDNHQTELADKMANLGHAVIGKTPEELCNLVLTYDEVVQKLQTGEVSKPTLGKALKKWLEEGA
ncbi:MAG: glycosyltransferase [Planctomycetota bacterium]|nr:glycosyltransferase [Planctomycetota bacterium]